MSWTSKVYIILNEFNKATNASDTYAISFHHTFPTLRSNNKINYGTNLQFLFF